MSSEIFVSYSRDDVQAARLVVAYLKSKGFNTWRDQDQLRGGTNWDRELENAILRADVVVVLISASSLNSEMVRNELAWAIEEAKKPIIPLMLAQGLRLPITIKRKQWVEMWRDWDAGCAELYEALQDEVRTVQHQPPDFDEIFIPQKLMVVYDPKRNPFSDFGTAVHEDVFMGQTRALRRLRDRLTGVSVSSTAIIGERRMGKTSLLNYLVYKYAHHDDIRNNVNQRQFIFIYMDMMDVRTPNIASVMAIFREGIQRQTNIQPWSADDDGNLERFSTAINHFHAKNQYLVLCFDEFERALAQDIELDLLFETMRSAASNGKIAIITSTYESIDILVKGSRLTSPFHNIFTEITLSNWARKDWQKLIERGFAQTGKLLTPDYLDLIDMLSGGNPYLVNMSGYYIWDALDVEGDWDADIQNAVIREFRADSRKYFSMIWSRLGDDGRKDVASVLGYGNRTMSQAISERLIARGILNADGTGVFCQPFADFIRGELK
ncbi:MAG: TIR domain-containing protein [Anaerolineae bacterium]|nr:TIR domain-containing protein [Anaerolineae bacterium]